MRALIIGYGSIGKRHALNLLKIPNVKVIILTKQKIRNKNPRITIYHNLEQCMSEKPNVCFITNETIFHVSTAIQVAKYGIDMFLEKPLSNSMYGVPKLENLIHKKGIIVQIGCNLRFHPCIKKLKQLTNNGVIGKIISVQVENGSYLPDWHPYENYRNSYAARDDLGGGVNLTMIHEIDYLYWFFGKVKEVFSVTGKFSNLNVHADDLSVSILRFQNNIIGELHLDYFQRPDFRSCKIKGTKGVLYWDSESNTIKLFNAEKNKWLKVFRAKNYQRNQMYVDEIKHFLHCVKNHQRTINDLTQGIETLKISLGIKKSSRLKKLISISNPNVCVKQRANSTKM